MFKKKGLILYFVTYCITVMMFPPDFGVYFLIPTDTHKTLSNLSSLKFIDDAYTWHQVHNCTQANSCKSVQGNTLVSHFLSCKINISYLTNKILVAD